MGTWSNVANKQLRLESDTSCAAQLSLNVGQKKGAFLIMVSKLSY